MRLPGGARLGVLVMRGVMGTLEQVLRYLLAFSAWLGGAYLLAIINDGLFAIFLGSSMIIVGMYIPPRGGQTDRTEHSF
jgi:hypothetical protein